ncbi:histone-lysine N-methyltransferase SETMAR [Trichonephila clavipes]|nr:histone-lysine N-methyltransferase SETMAR [Trichonephila clavipes]
MTPEVAPPLLTTTPHQREDVSALDRFNVHRCPIRRVFSGSGLELVTRQATVRYLYHSATAVPEMAKRRGVVFHQDNSRPYTSVVTLKKLWELGREVLMHQPYSPDLAPSVYHLFLALQNFLSHKKWGSREDCENRLLEFLANKNQDFYERGTMNLP